MAVKNYSSEEEIEAYLNSDDATDSKTGVFKGYGGSGGFIKPTHKNFSIPKFGEPAVDIRLVGPAVQIYIHDFNASRTKEGEKLADHINMGKTMVCLENNMGQTCPICEILNEHAHLKTTPKESTQSDLARVWRDLVCDDESNNKTHLEFVFDIIDVAKATEKVKMGYPPGDENGYAFDYLKCTFNQFQQFIAHAHAIKNQPESSGKTEFPWSIENGRLIRAFRQKSENNNDIHPIKFEIANSAKKSGALVATYEPRQENDVIPKGWLNFPGRITQVVREEGMTDDSYEHVKRITVINTLYYQQPINIYETAAVQLDEFLSGKPKPASKKKDSKGLSTKKNDKAKPHKPTEEDEEVFPDNGDVESNTEDDDEIPF